MTFRRINHTRASRRIMSAPEPKFPPKTTSQRIFTTAPTGRPRVPPQLRSIRHPQRTTDDPFFLFPPALLPGSNHFRNSTFKSFETRLPRGRLRPLNQPENRRGQTVTSLSWLYGTWMGGSTVHFPARAPQKFRAYWFVVDS